MSLGSQIYGLGIRDQRSRIRKKCIPDPEDKKAPDSGSETLQKTHIIKILYFYIFSLKNQYHGKFLQFKTVIIKGDFAHLSRKCGITSTF